MDKIFQFIALILMISLGGFYSYKAYLECQTIKNQVPIVKVDTVQYVDTIWYHKTDTINVYDTINININHYIDTVKIYDTVKIRPSLIQVDKFIDSIRYSIDEKSKQLQELIKYSNEFVESIENNQSIDNIDESVDNTDDSNGVFIIVLFLFLFFVFLLWLILS